MQPNLCVPPSTVPELKGEDKVRRQIAAIMCSAVLGFMTLSSNAIAQQKTVKACQEEWRANKAANQASGITQKAYVAQCRGGTPAAEPTAAPAAPPAPPPAPTAATTGQKTVKACQEEWRANKAANQASGITQKAYVAQCRGGTPAAEPTAAPAHRRLHPQLRRPRLRDKRLSRHARRSGEPIRPRIKPAVSPKRPT